MPRSASSCCNCRTGKISTHARRSGGTCAAPAVGTADEAAAAGAGEAGAGTAMGAAVPSNDARSSQPGVARERVAMSNRTNSAFSAQRNEQMSTHTQRSASGRGIACCTPTDDATVVDVATNQLRLYRGE